MSLSPFVHTVLAYVVAIGLLWGYVAILWLSSRRQLTKESDQA